LIVSSVDFDQSAEEYLYPIATYLFNVEIDLYPMIFGSYFMAFQRVPLLVEKAVPTENLNSTKVWGE